MSIINVAPQKSIGTDPSSTATLLEDGQLSILGWFQYEMKLYNVFNSIFLKRKYNGAFCFKLSSPLSTLSIINIVGKSVCTPTTKYRTQPPTPTIIIIIPHNCQHELHELCYFWRQCRLNTNSPVKVTNANTTSKTTQASFQPCLICVFVYVLLLSSSDKPPLNRQRQ